MAQRVSESRVTEIAYDTLQTTPGDDDFLGCGGFSSVYRCYHPAHGTVAVKLLTINGQATKFSKEFTVQYNARSPHILHLVGITQKDRFVGIVLEYMPGGSLAKMIYNPDLQIPWTFRLRALTEAACGIAFLHNLREDKRVTHNDIKAENMLLTADLHVKISDFGSATYSSVTGSTIGPTQYTDGNNEDMQRTASHSAPEFLENAGGRQTKQMDVYSFAVVIYTVITRERPFKNANYMLIFGAVKNGQRPNLGLNETKEDLEFRNMTEDLRIFDFLEDLMNVCWNQEPKNRPPMIQNRENMTNQLSRIQSNKIDDDISVLRKKVKTEEVKGRPHTLINIWQKFNEIYGKSQQTPSVVYQPRPVPRNLTPHTPTSSDNRQHLSAETKSLTHQSAYSHSHQPILSQPSPSSRSNMNLTATPRTLVKSPDNRQYSSAETAELSLGITPYDEEFRQNFADPFIRIGATVQVINEIMAVKNAQVGHGGWKDNMKELLGKQGKVKKIEFNGDVVVSFFEYSSQKFNPEALKRIPSENDLNVGDYVTIQLEEDSVAQMQENHGGWFDGMISYIYQIGLIFRFLPDASDALVGYEDGKCIRYNPVVLTKCKKGAQFQEYHLPDNPSVKVGDYVCHDMEEDVMKYLHQGKFEWYDDMAGLRGKVAKLIGVDKQKRALVAYSSKISFRFNPIIIVKLTPEEARRRFIDAEKRASEAVREKASQQQIQHHKFAIDDLVRVHLPIDLVVELQKGHGGWCHRMLEVYGLKGVVKKFDENENAQVLFDTGSQWSFNTAVLEKVPRHGEVPPPLYTPPFKMGSQVRVYIEEFSNASLNEMLYACKLLDIPEDKVDALTKIGTVVGINHNTDVVVSFGEAKNYAIKQLALKNIN